MAMLKSRGLLFDDEYAAIEYLKIISYFRLANYWKPMEIIKFAVSCINWQQSET